MILTPAERRAQMDMLLAEHVKDQSAIDFINDWLWAFCALDDLIDGDVEQTDDLNWEIFETLLYKLPGNPFFFSHAPLLLPAMKMAMSTYEMSTAIERRAQTANIMGEFEASEDCRAYRELRSSFELRNTCLDLALRCVELLHGPRARRVFSVPWFEASRDYEHFDVYVAKVTAEQRPKKRQDDNYVERITDLSVGTN